MGRAPCCDKASVKRGPWSPEEDATLKNYVEKCGTGGNWIALPQRAGLKRCGKSCRLRWLNYLRPGIKHGGFSEEEDNVICSLFQTIGSRWSVIASHLPGRTDNDVKNHWNTKLKKKMLAAQAGLSLIHRARPPPVLVKSENYGFGSFSMPNENCGGFGPFSMSYENSSSSTLTSIDASLPFDIGNFVRDSASFTALAPADMSSCGGGGDLATVSPSQDFSAASSSLSTENSTGYVSWSGNGGGGIDAFLMDLGLSQADLLAAGRDLF